MWRGRGCFLYLSRGGAEKIPQGETCGARRAEDDFFRAGGAYPLINKEKCVGGSHILGARKRLPPSIFLAAVKGYAAPHTKKAATLGGTPPLFLRIAP